MSPAGGKLAHWLKRLESFSPHEIELGLERVSAVLERMQLALPNTVLHVGGTNGKGSSVAILDSLLRSAGLRSGAYTSPHIHEFNERIQVDGLPVGDDEIVAAFERVEDARLSTRLTYFEYATLAALAVFDARALDVCVLEVGLGGRLDAVNAVDTSACVITNVSLDHCDWLGDDIESIAAEKAGVMRAGKPAVFGSDALPAAIVRHADDICAALIVAGRDYQWQRLDSGWRWRGKAIDFECLAEPMGGGEMWLSNAAGALALLEAAGLLQTMTREQIDRGLESADVAGRLQRIDRERQWLLDVAHNPAAAETLAAELQCERFAGRRVAIVAMLDDKDVDGVVRPLRKHVDDWIAFTAESPRAIDAAELARRIANATNEACLIAASIDEAIVRAREITSACDRVLVTGSFFAVGPALEALGIYSRGLGNS